MKQFEYKIEKEILGDTGDLVDMTELGLEGWELCSVLSTDNYIFYFFKREIEKVDHVLYNYD